MIKYYKHAEDQIKERKISKKEVEMTIKSPIEVVSGYGNRKVAHRVFDDKLLRAIYEKKEDKIIVISAYRAEPKRYLRR
ncbi:MAG: DUF4258 domain-containing protein [Methanomicrobia archaeon]|nr:DUF4258 domain-containing protein [Methanomicrobia archaeon]